MDFSYDLFVSYSTDPDYALVRHVESSLESFHQHPAILTLRLKELSICVDGSDFKLPHPACPEHLAEVKPVLEFYLSRCRYLLICCSTASRTSSWVRFELEWFLANRGADSILLAVTEGEDPATLPRQVFSDTIIGAGLHKKPWYDFRGFNVRHPSGWSKVRDFDDAWLALAAHLNGRALSDVRPQWRRQRELDTRRASLERYSSQLSRATKSWRRDPRKSMSDLSECAEEHREFAWRLFRSYGETLVRVAPQTSFAFACATFSHDGEILATGGGDFENSTELILWDMGSLTPARRLIRHTQRVRACVFLSNDTLVSGGMDGRVIVWSRLDGRPEIELPVGAGVTALAAKADHQNVIVGDEAGNVAMYALPSGRMSSITKTADGILDLAISPDQKTIAVASGHSIFLIDLVSGERAELRKHTSYVWAVAFDPSGRMLVSGGADETICAWDPSSRRLLWESREPDDVVSSLDFAPDGSRLVVGSRDGLVTLWDPFRGTREATLRGHNCDVYAVEFSRDGRQLVSAGGKKLADPGELFVWESDVAVTGERLVGHNLSVECIAVSPDCEVAVTGAGLMVEAQSELKVWALQTGSELANLDGHEYGITALAFSPAGKVLVSGAGDQIIRAWDVDENFKQCKFAELENTINSLSFNSSGSLLAASTFGRLVVFDVKQARPVLVIPCADVHIRSVAFSPRGDVLAYGGADGLVVLWDVRRAEELIRFPRSKHEIASVAFTPCGNFLASAEGDDLEMQTGALRLWDVNTGSIAINFYGHVGPVNCVNFSPDGRTMASGGYDHSVRLWEPTTGHELALLSAHSYNVRAVAFSGDGRTMLSVGGNGRPRGEVICWRAHSTLRTKVDSRRI